MPVTLSGNTVIRNTTAALPFNPGTLFDGGANGAWYDPSDATTLFTTSAGTTPCAAPGAGAQVLVGRMLDKSGNGNHANAANDTDKRPELSARVNLLTYSEQFDNAAWTKVISTVASNSTTAPDGTLTADTLIPNAVAGLPYVRQTLTTVSGVNYTWSIYLKPAGYNWVFLDAFDGSNHRTWFNLSGGTVGTVEAGNTSTITAVGNGWYRCTLTRSIGAVSTVFAVAIVSGNNALNITGNGTDGIYVWGGDTRYANIGTTIPAYQRVADQYTYDTVGFPRYLRFDGVDDAMSTPANVNLSSTDKATVFAGVRKLSDAAGALLLELSATSAANAGTFNVGAPSGAAANYGLRANGSADNTGTFTTYAAPISNVLAASLTTSAVNAAAALSLRVNGTVASLTVGNSFNSTGNFGTYPLFIGARNKASLFFNGYIYGLTVVGSSLSAGQITSMEQWQAGKTGISI